jgi:hypothetical protein
MLDSQTLKKIEDFVYAKPRSIQEISEHLGKNWRTADRYVGEIEKRFGTISTRVFRGGTKGALKIVYWASVEKVSHSIFQERLEQEIFAAKKKEDFSAFDIFQHVPTKNGSILIQKDEEENAREFSEILLSAQKQILFFSGNLSFINLKDRKKDLLNVFEELSRRGVVTKVLCRVDLAGKENIERLLSINSKQGKELIEVRHDCHPIRGFVLDGKLIRLKEVKEPTGKINELNSKKFIFYTISDKPWADWLSRVFWKKFSNSMDANRRLEQLNRIKNS